MSNESVTRMSPAAARVSLWAAAAFVGLLAALHAIKPELNPSWHFISEYAIGRFGWLMVMAFLSLALGYAALFVAVRSQLRSIVGRIGLALLLVSATGLVIAAIFTTDPLMAARDTVTMSGKLHNFGGALGMAMPFAAIIVSWKLAANEEWASARRPLIWAAGLAVIGFLVSIVSLGVMLSQSGGTFGPDVLVGWPNRLEILAYCAWLIIVARQTAKVSAQKP